MLVRERPPQSNTLADGTSSSEGVERTHSSDAPRKDPSLPAAVRALDERFKDRFAQVSEELYALRRGPAGRIRTDLTSAHLAAILNDQLARVEGADIAAILGAFSEAERPFARRVLGTISQFATLHALQAIPDAIPQNDGAWSRVRKCSLSDVLKYLSEKSIIDLQKKSTVDTGVRISSEQRAVLDAFLVERVRSDGALAERIASGDLSLCLPAAFTDGISPFSCPFPSEIYQKTRAILDEVWETVRDNDGGMSFDDALSRVLSNPLLTALEAAVAGHGFQEDIRSRVQIISEKVEDGAALSNQELAERLNEQSKIDESEVDAALQKLPAEYQDLAKEFFIRTACVYSSRSLALLARRVHEEVRDIAAKAGAAESEIAFYVGHPGKSYSLSTMLYCQANNIAATQVVDGSLPESEKSRYKVIVVVDDLAGTGASLDDTMDDARRDFPAQIAIGSPLVATSRSLGRKSGIAASMRKDSMRRLAPGDVIRGAKHSPFYLTAGPKVRETIDRLIGPSAGYGSMALAVSFPHMSPDNNCGLWACTLADRFTLHTSAVKGQDWNKPEAVSDALKQFINSTLQWLANASSRPNDPFREAHKVHEQILTLKALKEAARVCRVEVPKEVRDIERQAVALLESSLPETLEQAREAIEKELDEEDTCAAWRRAVICRDSAAALRLDRETVSELSETVSLLEEAYLRRLQPQLKRLHEIVTSPYLDASSRLKSLTAQFESLSDLRTPQGNHKELPRRAARLLSRSLRVHAAGVAEGIYEAAAALYEPARFSRCTESLRAATKLMEAFNVDLNRTPLPALQEKLESGQKAIDGIGRLEHLAETGNYLEGLLAEISQAESLRENASRFGPELEELYCRKLTTLASAMAHRKVHLKDLSETDLSHVLAAKNDQRLPGLLQKVLPDAVAAEVAGKLSSLYEPVRKELTGRARRLRNQLERETEIGPYLDARRSLDRFWTGIHLPTQPDLRNIASDTSRVLAKTSRALARKLAALSYEGTGCDIDQLFDLAGRLGSDVLKLSDEAHSEMMGYYRSVQILRAARELEEELTKFETGEGDATVVRGRYKAFRRARESYQDELAGLRDRECGARNLALRIEQRVSVVLEGMAAQIEESARQNELRLSDLRYDDLRESLRWPINRALQQRIEHALKILGERVNDDCLKTIEAVKESVASASSVFEVIENEKHLRSLAHLRRTFRLSPDTGETIEAVAQSYVGRLEELGRAADAPVSVIKDAFVTLILEGIARHEAAAASQRLAPGNAATGSARRLSHMDDSFMEWEESRLPRIDSETDFAFNSKFQETHFPQSPPEDAAIDKTPLFSKKLFFKLAKPHPEVMKAYTEMMEKGKKTKKE